MTLPANGTRATARDHNETLDRVVQQRVAATNAARAQFLGGAFALTFLVTALVDAWAVGTLRHHAFMFGQLAAALAVVVLVRATRFGARHAGVVFVAGMSIVSASGAAHLAQFGGLDGPHFYGVYSASPILIPMLLPLRARIAGTILTVGSFVLVYWLCRPDLFSHPMAHMPVSYLFAIGGISIALGQYVQRLEEGNFVDVARLEAVAKVLHDQLQSSAEGPAHIRREIARQLHDDVAQLITGARLHLDGWSRRRAKDEVVTRLSELLDELAGRSRRMIEELREPPECGPLVSELERLRDEYARLGLTVELITSDRAKLDALDPAHVDVLVASTREALTNVARHSRATHVIVSATIDAQRIALDVADNGGGRAANIHEGYGLRGVRERVESVRGELALLDDNDGIRVSIGVPIAVIGTGSNS